jgi:hypothetical protein
MDTAKFEAASSYDRLYQMTYNHLLRALIDEGGGEDGIVTGLDASMMDPELFRLIWNRNQFSQEDGICLEVRRINLGVKDPLPLSEKIKPWGDVIRAKLIRGNLTWNGMMSKDFSLEQNYSIPEDFSQLVADTITLINEF